MKFNAKRVKDLLDVHKATIPDLEEMSEKIGLDFECLDAIEQCAEHQKVITDDVLF